MVDTTKTYRLNRQLNYMVRTPWSWVFKEAHNDIDLMQEMDVENIFQLSTFRSFMSAPDGRKSGPSTLRAELLEEDENGSKVVKMVVLGSSAALEGLSDKDEFVRTLRENGADFSIPPSILIDWDASEEDISKIQFPVCNATQDIATSRNDNPVISVLKTPLGSRGEGVFFVSTHKEIWEKVKINYERAKAEGNGKFIKEIYQSKGRIPSWVLSGEVKSIKIMSRKCHMRTYVAIVERSRNNENSSVSLWDGYVYNRHEVRVAEIPVSNDEIFGRDRRAHITNGASSGETGRYVLDEIDILVQMNVGKKLENFVETIFRKLENEIRSRILKSRREILHLENKNQKKIALAGIDIMLDTDDKFYILEVNVNPAAPPKEFVSDTFKRHLINFAKDTLNLALGGTRSNKNSVGGWIKMENFHTL